MSLRKGIAIALLTLISGVASAATKHPADAACTEHVKKMEGMKTSAERTAYCKGNEECSSHNCTKMVAHHKHKSSASAKSKTQPKTTTP